MKKDKYNKHFYSVMKHVVGAVLWPVYRFKYTNPKKIPKDGRYIFAGNHISATDAILVGVGQKRRIRFMAKAELFTNPVIGWLLTKLGAFPVNRGKGDWDSINYAKGIIDSGESLGIFIEGTRSKTGELLRPKSGAVMIAHQMDCKIVPVSITYRTKKLHLFSRRYISFGEPVTVEELGIINGSPREYREASRQLMEKIRVMWERDKNGNKTR